MATNINIRKKDGENANSALRRFTQKVRSSGILPKVKSQRFNDRSPSKLMKKQKALRRIEKRAERARMDKLGKLGH
tara:strand:+ start:18 stop:245 length:228 start_codon:yes stop_codon:yes gene_type:complete